MKNKQSYKTDFKMWQQKIFIIVLSFFVIACNKDEGCDCFDSTGRNVCIYRELSDFTKLELSENINLVLIQDTINNISISGGKNVLKGVLTYCENGTLFIKNVNKCNWIRNYNRKINAVLRYKTLNNISYKGTGIIKTENVLKTDKFTFDCWDGAGDINIDIVADETHFNMHLGTSNIKVTGVTKDNYIYTFSYGTIDCNSLLSRNVYITHRGTNNCYVFASEQLFVNINYIGNVYYTGQPSIIETNIQGSGQVIDLN